MRRIIQNTTAIAACLSLLAPHAVMAQTDATAEAAAAAEAEAAVETCADGSVPPCETAAEPAPVDEAAPVEEAAPDAAADAAVEAEVETAPEAVVEELAPVEAEAIEAAPEAEAAAEAEAGAEPVEKEVTPEVMAEPTAETTEAPAAAAEAEAVNATAEEAAAEAEAEMTAEPDATAAEAETATTEAPAELAAEPDATAAPEAAAEAEAAAATEAEAEVAPQADATTTAPSAQPVETEAAKAAAEATAAPTAAALSEDAGEAQVTEEQVTEDNSRSSAEDFQAALEDALENSGEQQQAESQAAASEDDGDNDLTKALLLGLGGLAVGAMLNNNREVALSTPDRVVITHPDGSQQIIKDEVALLRQPGSTVTTENFDDGSSRTTVTRADGSKVVTIRDADLRVLRRTLVSADGTTTMLIDDTAAEPVDLASLPTPTAAAEAEVSQLSEDDLRAALRAESSVDRRFSLAQIRDIAQVRSLVAPVNIDAITFDTGSAAIDPDQAQKLSALGNVIRESVAENPAEVFLVEAHTDTVGSDAANLALSDRRAESVALALSEYFQVPPENLVVQGYGEQQLKVAREGDVRENRRAAVRRITGLLQQ